VAFAEPADPAQLSMAVNLSASQLHHPDFVDDIFSILDETGADPR
jgi:EAL domain-containing protein (putative c-di-GMP-specific phosphodiesterase class I)